MEGSPGHDPGPLYPTEPPKTAATASRRPKRLTSLVEHEEPLFEITEAKFAPGEGVSDVKHRAVRRVRIWEHHGDEDESTSGPNLYQVLPKLNSLEHYAPKRMNQYAEFDQELKDCDIRERLVNRGCSLVKLFRAPPRVWTPVNPQLRFAAVKEILQRNPAKMMDPPTARKVEFTQPFTGRLPDRVDLVSKISFAETQQYRLKEICQVSERLDLQIHNELIHYLNHKNARRFRASEKFFGELHRCGLKQAQANAQRESQRSRLRVMGSTPWWEEFITFAFSGHVGAEEEKLIQRICRQPEMTLKEYYDYLRELENRKVTDDRCLELLKWLNAKCKYADDRIIELLKYDQTRQRRSLGRSTSSVHTP
jgi:hypothetical protein